MNWKGKWFWTKPAWLWVPAVNFPGFTNQYANHLSICIMTPPWCEEIWNCPSCLSPKAGKQMLTCSSPGNTWRLSQTVVFTRKWFGKSYGYLGVPLYYISLVVAATLRSGELWGIRSSEGIGCDYLSRCGARGRKGPLEGKADSFQISKGNLGGGFTYFFIFIPTQGNDSIWLIFWKMGWNHQLVWSSWMFLWVCIICW